MKAAGKITSSKTKQFFLAQLLITCAKVFLILKRVTTNLFLAIWNISTKIYNFENMKIEEAILYSLASQNRRTKQE